MVGGGDGGCGGGDTKVIYVTDNSVSVSLSFPLSLSLSPSLSLCASLCALQAVDNVHTDHPLLIQIQEMLHKSK